jgi:hypothetical protein
MGISRVFKTHFLSLILRHQNAVTLTCDQHAWFSFVYIYIDITPPFCNYTPELRVSVLSFYPWCFFSGGLPFALLYSSKELLFSSPFLQ